MAFDLATAQPANAPAPPKFDIATARPAPATAGDIAHALGSSAEGVGEAGVQTLQSLYAGPLAAISREVARAVPGADPDKVHDAVINGLVSHFAPNATRDTITGALSLPFRAAGALADKGISALPESAQPFAQGLKGVAGDVASLAPAAPTVEAVGTTLRSIPKQTVARSPADVAAAAGYTGLKTKADLKTPGATAITNKLIGSDAQLQPGQTPTIGTIRAARNSGPAKVYNQAENTLPDGMEQDQQLIAGLKSIGDTTSQLPKSPDVDALKTHMLDQPTMTSAELFSNIRTARAKASALQASDNPDQAALGDAYGSLADRYEEFAGRQLSKYSRPDSPVSLQRFQQARVDFAKSYAAEAALKGENFDPLAYGRIAQRNPDLLSGNGAIVGHVANGLPDAPTAAAGTAGSLLPSAVGAAAASTAAHIASATGHVVPGGEGAAGVAGALAGPVVKQGVKNVQTRGNPEAADAASTNPALSYFRRPASQDAPAPAPLALSPTPGTVGQTPQQTNLGPLPQGPGPNPDLQLSQPPGSVIDPLQRPLGDMMQGPGPNPDLKLTPPEGQAFDANQTPLGRAQNPHNWTPPAPSQGSLFDELSLEHGAPRAAPFNALEQAPDLLAGYKPPDELPNGGTFSGTLHRGTPEGAPDLNEHGFRFLSSSPEQAAEYGDVTAHDADFKNVLDEGSPAKNAKALGLPDTANQIDIARAARKAGYDAVKTKVGKADEYADLTSPEPDQPLGNQIADQGVTGPNGAL
jgi:hypothetical protein